MSDTSIYEKAFSYYKFDEDSGTTLIDSHDSNNGSIIGSSINRVTDSKLGPRALEFTGSATTDRVTLSDVTFYLPYTFNMWVKPVVNTNTKTLISNYDSVYRYRIQFKNQEIEWGVMGASRQVPFVYANEYYMITLVLERPGFMFGDATARLYINGVEVDSYTVTSLPISGSTTVTIGAFTSESPNNFNGVVDEVLLCFGGVDASLTAPEIAALYNIGKGLEHPFEEDISEDLIESYEFEEGLEETKFNNSFKAITLKSQNVSELYPNICAYPDSDGTWRGCWDNTPVGVYVGDGHIILKGICPISADLEPGKFYYMNRSGGLTHDYSNAFNGVKVGYALDVNTLLVDIEILEDNLPVSPGIGDLVFTTAVGDRQFSNLIEGVDYEVDDNTLYLHTNRLYKFNNINIGSGTTLTVLKPENRLDGNTLSIECDGNVDISGTVDLHDKLDPGNFAGFVYSVDEESFTRAIGGIGGASNHRGWSGHSSGFGHGGTAGTSSATGGTRAYGGSGSSAAGTVTNWNTVGVTGSGNWVEWRGFDDPSWNEQWAYWDGGHASISNSRGAAGGGGGAYHIKDPVNVWNLDATGGQTSNVFGADGQNGSASAQKDDPGQPWSASIMRAAAGGSGGNGGRAGVPGCNLYLKGNNITISGTIDSSGTDGGNGGNGGRNQRITNISDADVGGRHIGYGGYGGTGGGGGSGGKIVIKHTGSYTVVGTINVSKGVGGSGGFRPFDNTGSSLSGSPNAWEDQEGSGQDGNDGSINVEDIS